MGRCPLKKLYHLLGKRWSIQLMHYLSEGDASFNDLQKDCGSAINSALLSSRLKEMVSFRIITKEIIYGIIRYRMTEQGKELFTHMHKIKDWAQDSGYDLPDECRNGTCVCRPNADGPPKRQSP